MYDVVTIGTGTRDIFLRSDKIKAIHDARHFSRFGFPGGMAECLPYGAKIEIDAPIMAIGGGAANAAVTFARHGLKTAAVLELGQDAEGKDIEKTLSKEKIRVAPLWDHMKGTAWSAIILSPTGERTILTYRGASADLDVKKVPSQHIKAKWAYIVPGHVPFEAMYSLVRGMRENDTRIFMNPSQAYVNLGLKKMEKLLSLIDVLMLNREEAATLVGVDSRDLRKIFDRLDEYAAHLTVVTDGSKGVLVSDHPHLKSYRSGIFREKKLLDRTGAGDAFGSGFLSALIARNWQGEDDETTIKEAIRFASANATAVVEQVGAQRGILKKSEYKKETRFRNLHVSVTHI